MQSSVAYSDAQLREPTIAPTPKTICALTTKRELIPVKMLDLYSGEDYLSIDIDIFSYALSARSPRVPTEVAENIIDLVTDGSVMRCCALVCTAWLPRSRVNIWRTIGLVHLRQVYSLRAVLEKTPEVRGLVRVLNFGIWETVVTNTALVTILPLVPHLDSIRIAHNMRNLSPTASAWINTHQNIRRLTLETFSKDLIQILRFLSHINSLEFLHLRSNEITREEEISHSRYDISSLARRCPPSLHEIEVRTEPCYSRLISRTFQTSIMGIHPLLIYFLLTAHASTLRYISLSFEMQWREHGMNH